MEPLDDHYAIARYILKYFEGELTEAEKIHLDRWVNANGQNWQLFEDLKNNNILQKELKKIDKIDTEVAWNQMVQKTQIPKNVISIKKPTRNYWWAIAASILLILGAGYLVFTNQPENITARAEQNVNLKNDFAPGGNKAILTLADGTKIVLDSANIGAITKQGNVTIIKLYDGLLSCDPSPDGYRDSTSFSPLTIKYNTITTPRGGQYQLLLADGSKVWLNAASSLRFPNIFPGKDRRVELTGEGYFEIVHNAKKPFYVEVRDMEVKVLGTHFNVNAYADEPNIRTTLLEGSVEVAYGSRSETIEPGVQAKIDNGTILLDDDVNLEAVMAWKNGIFNFYREDLHSVMRKISRWYDVEVEYRGKVNRHFGGTISRDVNASQVLEMLEITGDIEIKIEGEKVIVMP